MRRILVGGVITGLLFALGCKEDAPHPGATGDLAAPPDPAVLSTVRKVLEAGRHPWLRWPELTDVSPALADLYTGEADGLFWFIGEAPHGALAVSIEALARADERGLVPDDYDAKRLVADWNRLSAPPGIDPSERALFDLAVTVGVLREIQAVHSGRVDPVTLDWGFDVRPKKLDRVPILREARDGDGVGALLDRLEPSYPHYVRNRRELAHYRRLAQEGEPAPVPALPKGRKKIEPGDAWGGVAQLRARLELMGDLPKDAPAAAPSDGAPRYEAPLVDAVKRFQARHILGADGIVGAATIDAINVPLARRVRQLELAMERGRWLPRLNDRPTVFVNVPVFRLWASDPVRGEEPLRMNVVVGKSMSSHTPIFVQFMEYVVFRPYWNPPYSITTREILPAVRRDTSYLERENMEIVASGADDAPALPATPENLDAVAAGRLFVRQKPGPKNSLGLAKFIFPNVENVYMHGTPAQHLFSRTRRDFSHGCIRLENPVGLAEWVLRDVPGWTRERIEAAMQGERPTRVNLKEPLMVVIFYDTVHVNSEGVVHFVGDIYGHDEALDQALARGYPYPEAD
jgi:murein L,D-transpeptidase YcbB/YkuD